MKTSDPKTSTTGLTKRKEKPQKYYLPEDWESDPSSSESSSSESHWCNNRKYKNKRRDKKKNHWNFTKQDSSDPFLSNSDSFNERYIKSKRLDKKNKYQKKKQDPVKLCAKLAANLLMKAYKSKTLK